MAAKKRSISAFQGRGLESLQACLPCAILSAQSNKSPMWARICAGVRVLSPMWKLEKWFGASRSALPPREATVATEWRRNWRAESDVEVMRQFPSSEKVRQKSLNAETQSAQRKKVESDSKI